MEIKLTEEMPVFQYSEADFTWHTQSWLDNTHSELSKFDHDLRKRWDLAMATGMFRYDVDHIVTRILPGPKRYVCQLNTKRNVVRRQPQVVTTVKEPFNHSIFNFTKIGKNEILFDLRKQSNSPDNGHHTHGRLSRQISNNIDNLEVATITNNKEACPNDALASSHAVIINVSPMEYGHSLFAPDRMACNPQVLTLNALTLAIETMLLSKHRGLTMGFNSLCANASVNHFHFHLLYLEHEILATHCKVSHLMGPVFEVTSLAIPGFALQLHGSSVPAMAKTAYKISSYLHQHDIAHNAILCRGLVFNEERVNPKTTVRLFIWPRQKYTFGSEESIRFFVACFELAGYITTFDESSYNCLTEHDADERISAVRLPTSTYEAIRRHTMKMAREACV